MKQKPEKHLRTLPVNADRVTRFLAHFAPYLIPVDHLGIRYDLLQKYNARYGAANAILLAGIVILTHYLPPVLALPLALFSFVPATCLGFSVHCLIRESLQLPPYPPDMREFNLEDDPGDNQE